MKDWTGNKRSTFATLGASNHTDYDRANDDYYATEPRVIDELMQVEKFYGGVWECACGEGHLSKELEKYFDRVISTDLIDRGYGTGGVDFLAQDQLLAQNVITNPPYQYAAEFVEHSLDLNAEKVAMFLKLTFLEGQKRYKLFQKYPPKRVWVYSSRRKVARNGSPEMFAESSAVAYAWFVWEAEYQGKPEIGWIL